MEIEKKELNNQIKTLTKNLEHSNQARQKAEETAED
jgi:hypothetical protein